MRRAMLCLAATMMTMAAAAPAPAQIAPANGEARRAEVLVLGVYHMSNPGRDIFNMQADDVLAPKRQAEIAQLMEVLKRFHPTRIALEADPYDARIPKRYADYLAGTYELSRNEDDQIAYRLGRALGLKAVYPVDADGDFPWQRVIDYAKASGRTRELDDIQAEIGAMVKAQDEYLHGHTVLETLLYMNADRKVAQDVGYYFREAHLGEPGDWAGADLVADWYRRNARIFTNITRLVESPDERILVIFGAGHLGWLRQMVAGDPTLRLRKLEEFAPAATAPAAKP